MPQCILLNTGKLMPHYIVVVRHSQITVFVFVRHRQKRISSSLEISLSMPIDLML